MQRHFVLEQAGCRAICCPRQTSRHLCACVGTVRWVVEPEKYYSLCLCFRFNAKQNLEIGVRIGGVVAMREGGWPRGLPLVFIRCRRRSDLVCDWTRNDRLVSSLAHAQNSAPSLKPFTPKSDQCQISPAASPEILYHSVRGCS